MRSGVFIVLEGSDAGITSTQMTLLKERLGAVGYDVEVFEFPQQNRQSSYFAKKYVNGDFGPAKQISPYTASLFYALDHFDAAQDINSALEEGKIVLASHYAGAMMAEQGAKISDDVQKRSYFVWADNMEFQLLNLPRPNLNVFLRAQPAADKKGTSDQESRRNKKLLSTYDLICRLFPKDFKTVECSKQSKQLSVPEINNLIWEQLKPLLPASKPHASHSVVVTLGMKNEELRGAESSDSTLSHDFKDGSLLLRLNLQRLVPDGVSHRFNGWHEGEYRFYTPNRLPKDVKRSYHEGLEQLSIIHQQLTHKMAAYIERSDQRPAYTAAQLLQPITPLAALSDFTLTISKRDVAWVSGKLLANDSEELQWAAKQLYLAARQKWPKDFEKALETADGPVALNNIVAKMAGFSGFSSGDPDEPVKLLEARPRLEFNLLAESVYPHSSLSLDEITEELSDWPYSQKFQSLKEAASQTEILQKVSYKLEVLSDHITLDKLIQTGHLKNIQVQPFSPRFGYDMPRLVDAAAADDIFDAAFDKCLEIYSQFQAASLEENGQYATLLGHKFRWQVEATSADLKPVLNNPELSSSPIIKALGEKLADTHPLLWEVITKGQTVAPRPEPKGKARVKQTHRSSRKRGGKPKRS